MRLVNSAETWQKAYQAFQQVNFSAWDFNSIKESLIDYMKLYYPEDFNDYIETSDLIMIVELFAYLGELFAYRYDLNAHENLLPVASIKQSVLRLSKLLSYKASRNIPARGLVKITSISVTEKIYDSKGNNLANKIIFWDDPNNSNWKEQFILVLNRILEQNFGTVAPDDRIQVQDVVFELYGMNNESLATETIPYNITVSGTSYPMELVSVELDEFGPIEKRPQKSQVMNIMYLNDGLGDSSNNTGFFFYTKQGSLQKTTTIFDGVTPNQTYTIAINNSNETDVWINNVDPDTGIIITGTDVTSTFKEGEWEEVDLANAQNILFNTNKNRNKYEIETLDNDQFKVIFGDGQFAKIPSGTFDIWSRTSANVDLVIPSSAIQNLSSSILYYDTQGNEQTLTLTFSLVDTIQNAAVTEDIEHIRRVAPSVYYTQDRMVNGRDYNEFMLQDNSILKLRAINRTFAGDSKYIAWHDPSEYYDNVKMYGNDLVVYFNTTENFLFVNNSDLPALDGGTNSARIAALITNYIQPLLSTADVYMRILLNGGINDNNIRKAFTNAEITNITAALYNSINTAPSIFYLNYDVTTDVWNVLVTTTQPADYWIAVTSYSNGNFSLGYNGKQIITHSEELTFWTANNISTLNYDTLNTTYDNIVLLQANIGYHLTGNCIANTTPELLTSNYNFYVIKQLTIDTGATSGELSTHDFVVLPEDANNDNIPDCVTLPYLINQSSPTYSYIGVVKAATTTALTATYNNGTSGVGATLTGGMEILVIDDYTPVLDDRILVKNQASGLQNGIYTLTVVGNNVTAWVLTRATDADTADELLTLGTYVENGTTNINSEWDQTATSIVVGTTPLVFEENNNDYVYFERTLSNDGYSRWVFKEATLTNILAWSADQIAGTLLWKRELGRSGLNFLWLHSSPRYNLVDPSHSNLMDMYIVTRGYYTNLKLWLNGQVSDEPESPSSFDLRNDYNYLIDNKMESDDIILHPGKIKVIIGSNAKAELKASLKVIKSASSTLTNNQIKATIVDSIIDYFDINEWEFGETFYFPEMATFIQSILPADIKAIVLVPTNKNNIYGDLFQVYANNDEIIQPSISIDDIDIVESLDPRTLR